MIPKLKIFCDFDGTITKKDVWIDTGEYFINDKVQWAIVLEKFNKGEIGARNCFLQEAALIENFDFEIFNKIIDKQEIDSHFGEFAEFCHSNNIPVYILSEGMEHYISRILGNIQADLPYYANAMIFSEDNKSFKLEFPNSDSDCDTCGCCKRNLILNLTGDDEISVYIGDGMTDTCAVQYADMVFAKKTLASYCWKNNITYFEYQNFSDIKNKLEKILAQKRIKHRQTAKFKRREVYLRG